MRRNRNTYKIPAEKADSLRKQLLWTQVAIFASVFLLFFFLGVGSFSLMGVAGFMGGVAAIWGAIAYWRSLWNLWEWPGIALGIGAAAGVALLNMLVPLIGMVASFAFFVYIYMQLGKQSGASDKVSSREIFSE